MIERKLPNYSPQCYYYVIFCNVIMLLKVKKQSKKLKSSAAYPPVRFVVDPSCNKIATDALHACVQLGECLASVSNDFSKYRLQRETHPSRGG